MTIDDYLEPLGLLNPAQREILAIYCETASVNFEAWKELTKSADGGLAIVVPSARDDDAHVKNPALVVWHQFATLLDQLSKSLLTSPAVLMRAEIPDFEVDDESDLD